MRRTQRPHRYERRVRSGGCDDPEDRDAASGIDNPRRRLTRHADVGRRAGARRGSFRDYRIAGRRAGRRLLCEPRGSRRSGSRHQGDAEPRRLPRGARHRPRSCGGRHGAAEPARHDAHRGPLPLADRDPYRGPQSLSAISRPPHPRPQKRAEPALAAREARGDRAQADFGIGRYHEFPDLRREPASACV